MFEGRRIKVFLSFLSFPAPLCVNQGTEMGEWVLQRCAASQSKGAIHSFHFLQQMNVMLNTSSAMYSLMEGSVFFQRLKAGEMRLFSTAVVEDGVWDSIMLRSSIDKYIVCT